jgi:hypothetical protein
MMQTRPENPFYMLNPISDPTQFYGQSLMLDPIYSTIKHGQSVSLVGPRRTGKSSILRCMGHLEIQARFRYDLSRLVFVYLDLRTYLKKTCSDFFDDVSRKIISACSGELTFQLPPVEGEDKFSQLLEQVTQQGFHIVLLLDAFDNVIRNQQFDPEFFLFLRAQAMAGQVCYVTASISPLSDISHPGIKTSPFFNIFWTCPMKPLTPDEARDLVIKPSSLVGLPFSEIEADLVLKAAGRNPFFIQRVSYFLFEEKSLSGRSGINKTRVMKHAYDNLFDHFRYLWEDLNEKQKELMKIEAQRKNPSVQELPLLSESYLFRRYVRETYQLRIVQLSREDIAQALKHIRNIEFLGTSNLCNLQIVSARLKNGSASSVAEKGAAVREVLIEAFESLQGPGMRTDLEPEWQSYNILYYRYFKFHWPQARISLRLEATSLRQYYREWNMAIEALYNSLLTMDTLYDKEFEE